MPLVLESISFLKKHCLGLAEALWPCLLPSPSAIQPEEMMVRKAY